eukprot:gene1179-1747_t
MVFAPCSPIAGGDVNWIAKTDKEIIDATMQELERLFPTEIGPGASDGVGAKLLKSVVVKTPRSVYAAIPGRNKYRPSQKSPISNLSMCGCYTSQKFLGSMEGAVLAGKLAAEVVATRAAYGESTQGMKKINEDVMSEMPFEPRKPRGQLLDSDSPIVYGGGTVVKMEESASVLKAQDPEQLVGYEEIASA